MNKVLEQALVYASAGLAVFPIPHKKKVPYTPNGYHDASTNLKIIEAWWKDPSITGIGIKIPDNYVILDIDGDEGLNVIQAHDFDIVSTLTATTGKKSGYHFWYKLPDGITLPKRKINLLGDANNASHVDLMVNGYIVAPPSIHPNGVQYKWKNEFDFSKVVEAPDWIVEICKQETKYSTKSKIDPDEILSGIEEGNRNVSLFRYACYIRGQRNLSLKEGIVLLTEAANACSPPYSKSEARKIAERVWKSYKTQDPPKGFKVYKLTELMKADLPQPKYFVYKTVSEKYEEGLIPTGVVLLSSAPKRGKSALAAFVSAAIAKGEKLWDTFETRQTTVLYFDLEQSVSPAIERWNRILNNIEPPSTLDVVFDIDGATIGNGFLELLSEHLRNNPHIGVVVIDTLADIWPSEIKAEGTLYNKEQSVMKQLSQIANDFDISLVLVHHDNKGADKKGSIRNPSGSFAIAGKAHAILNLQREDGSNLAKLSVTGKNIPESRLTLIFDQQNFQWTLQRYQ